LRGVPRAPKRGFAGKKLGAGPYLKDGTCGERPVIKGGGTKPKGKCSKGEKTTKTKIKDREDSGGGGHQKKTRQ